MKQVLYNPYTKAAGAFLAIFALAAMLFFSSCTIQRGCPGAGRENGFVGYDAGGYHAARMAKRISY
jgi:hypothetical protein